MLELDRVQFRALSSGSASDSNHAAFFLHHFCIFSASLFRVGLPRGATLVGGFRSGGDTGGVLKTHPGKGGEVCTRGQKYRASQRSVWRLVQSLGQPVQPCPSRRLAGRQRTACPEKACPPRERADQRSSFSFGKGTSLLVGRNSAGGSPTSDQRFRAVAETPPPHQPRARLGGHRRNTAILH